MQTIREAKIVIHLESGPVKLKSPDLSEFLAQQRQQLDYAKQYEQQLVRVVAAQRAAAQVTPAAMPGGGGAGASGGAGAAPGADNFNKQMERQVELTKQLEDATVRLIGTLNEASKIPPPGSGGGKGQTPEEYEREIEKLQTSMNNLFSASMRAGEGIFRIGRAIALLGASDSSLQQLIQSLAKVQAYWDLMAGTIKIVQAITLAQRSLVQVQAAYQAAIVAGTIATNGLGGAMARATIAAASLATGLAVLAAPLVILAALVASAVIIWDLLTESEEEAAEAAKKYAEEARKAAEASSAQMNEAIAAQQKVNDIRRAYMTLEQQSESLRRESSREADFGRSQEVEARRGGGAESQHLQDAVKAYHDVIALERERLAVQTKIRDAAIEEQREKIKQIETQERLVESAQRQQQIEHDKLRAFQAQVGALSQFEQDQLIQIRDKLRAGQDINQFEEDFFAQNAGARGAGVINERRAKRGEAAGFGDDFLDGLEGAGKGVADASDALAKAVADLAKLIGDAGSAAEAKARYEQRIKEINAEFEEFLKSNTEIVTKYLGTIEQLNDRIRQLEEAAIKG